MLFLVVVGPVHSLVLSDLQPVNLTNRLFRIFQLEVFQRNVAPELRVKLTVLQELIALRAFGLMDVHIANESA